MSYSVSVYAVDLFLLRSVLDNPHHPARGTLNADVGTAEGRALSALLGGPRPQGLTAADLAYALERLCDRLGRRVGSNGLSGIRSAFLEGAYRVIDPVYAPTGFSLQRLVEGGPPVALPPPDDFPAVGFVENDVVARAHAFTEAESPTLEDPDLDQVLVDLAEWLAVAASRGWGLVAFYA